MLKKYYTKLFLLENLTDLSKDKLVFKKISIFKPQIIIFDINDKLINKRIQKIIKSYNKDYYLVGIDSGKKNIKLFNFNWISSLQLENSSVYKFNNKKIHSGPDSILINFKKKKIIKKKNSILILAGTGESNKSVSKIVNFFEKKIEKKYNLTIIQSPYSKNIKITKYSYHNWKVIKAPLSIDKHLSYSEIVIVKYGVSFFEALSYNCKIIFFTKNFKREKNNIKYIIKNNLAIYCAKFDEIEKKMNHLKKLKHKNYFPPDHTKKILLKFDEIVLKSLNKQ